MAKNPKAEELAGRASFIFRGRVKKLKASTMPNVPVTPQTIVVTVNEILRAPDALSYYTGADITVQLGSRETIAKGDEAVFYTNSWMVGESLAVQSVGHVAAATESAKPRASRATKRSTRAFPADADAAQQAESGLRKQLEKADMVVTGKVTSVRVVDAPSPPSRGTKRGVPSSPEEFQPVSEHSPVWQEAVIDVAGVEKGDRQTPRRIVVRFPDSTDVRWHESPKLHLGQEGVFLLRREGQPTPENPTRTRTLAPAAKKKTAADHYTALDPAAVQPIQKIDAIRTLIKKSK